MADLVDSMAEGAGIDKGIRLARQGCIGDIPQAGEYASAGFVLIANKISVDEAIKSFDQTRGPSCLITIAMCAISVGKTPNRYTGSIRKHAQSRVLARGSCR
jgi:hypothetical protein